MFNRDKLKHPAVPVTLTQRRHPVRSVHIPHTEVNDRERHAPPGASSPEALSHYPPRCCRPRQTLHRYQRNYRWAVPILALLIVFTLGLPVPVTAAVGDRVELKATHHAG